MKKYLMMALLLCATGVMAEDVLLKSWELDKKDAYSTYMTKKQGAKLSVNEGVVSLEVTRNDAEQKNSSEIQFWCNYANGFQAGTKYRVEGTIKADKDVSVIAQVILSSSPYTQVMAKTYTLKAGEAASIQMEFTPKDALTGTYRTPCLFLGHAFPGTVFEISGIKLYEVK